MHPAEKMIRQDISKLTKYRLAPVTESIKQDIKYAFWHGFIDEKIYNNLHKELEIKRDSLWNDFQ